MHTQVEVMLDGDITAAQCFMHPKLAMEDLHCSPPFLAKALHP